MADRYFHQRPYRHFEPMASLPRERPAEFGFLTAVAEILIFVFLLAVLLGLVVVAAAAFPQAGGFPA